MESKKTLPLHRKRQGEMAEWSIAAVLKTVEGHTSGGSNPSLSANNLSKTAVTQKVTAVFIFTPYNDTYNIGCELGHIQNRWCHKESIR